MTTKILIPMNMGVMIVTTMEIRKMLAQMENQVEKTLKEAKLKKRSVIRDIKRLPKLNLLKCQRDGIR